MPRLTHAVARVAGSTAVTVTAGLAVATTGTLGPLTAMAAVAPSAHARAALPAGKQLYAYVTNANTDTVSVISLSTEKVIRTITVLQGPEGIAFTRDGGYAYVADNGSAAVSVINTSTGTVTRTIRVPKGPVGVAVSPQTGPKSG